MDFFSFLWYTSLEVREMNSFEEKTFGSGLDGCELLYCGKRMRNFGHSYGPHRREDFLIYYIKEGHARLRIGREERTLSGGDIFVNFPNSSVTYVASPEEAWSIKWISATGPRLESHLALVGLTRECPYRRAPHAQKIEELFDEMYEQFDRAPLAARFYCLSLMYRLFSLLSEEGEEGGDARIRKARALIAEHYADPEFGVAQLAAMLGLHHNYFSVLYKKETGEPPIRAITEARLAGAAKMLRFTDRGIKEIAFASGFLDELYFSRAFRARYGLAPTAYRRSLLYPI